MSKSRKIGLVLTIVSILLLSLAAIALVWNDFASSPSRLAQCFTTEMELKEASTDPMGFEKCIAANALNYTKYDYSEAKDLAKAFLTLLTAVFVASITFSEKIVDLKTASTSAVVSIVCCWTLLLLALIACGAGLAYLVWALGYAVHFPRLNFYYFQFRGAVLLAASGVAFGLALSAMFVAGLISLVRQTRESRHVGQTEGDAFDPL